MTAPLFHVGDILSVMTGCIVSPNGFSGAHRLAEHMAGEPIWTHQLPRVFREAEPVLREAFPALATVNVPTEWGADPQAAVLAWIQGIEQTHGAMHEVPTLGVNHTHIDPVKELTMMGITAKVASTDDDSGESYRVELNATIRKVEKQ